MRTQMGNAAVINAVVQQGLFQGMDMDSPASHGLVNATGSTVPEIGTDARDENGNLVAQCGVDLLDNAICGP